MTKELQLSPEEVDVLEALERDPGTSSMDLHLFSHVEPEQLRAMEQRGLVYSRGVRGHQAEEWHVTEAGHALLEAWREQQSYASSSLCQHCGEAH